MSEERMFSVEDAQALLPGLSESLLAIRKARQSVLAGGERIRRGAPTNGGGAQGVEYWEALATLRKEVESISGQGIILRDADSGLVDFPTMREGREVFLCWRLGEDRVAYWHGPETGFSGRRPL
jgi:hypothetical protein